MLQSKPYTNLTFSDTGIDNEHHFQIHDVHQPQPDEINAMNLLRNEYSLIQIVNGYALVPLQNVVYVHDESYSGVVSNAPYFGNSPQVDTTSLSQAEAAGNGYEPYIFGGIDAD